MDDSIWDRDADLITYIYSDGKNHVLLRMETETNQIPPAYIGDMVFRGEHERNVEDRLRLFREGFDAGVHSIKGVPTEIEDREAFRNLRRRVTLSTVEAGGLSAEDEQALHRAIQEAREVGEVVLDRIIAEHINRTRSE